MPIMDRRSEAIGLFVGMTTLDLIYLATAAPGANQKVVALDTAIAAGGPATNAAVAFAHLGGQARLLSVLGSHPITELVRSDLAAHAITHLDLAPDHTPSPPVSSITVTQATGARSVISMNAVKFQADPSAALQSVLDQDTLQNVDVVLIDGHQMAVSAAIAAQARAAGIPVVLDGGSWKPGFETVLPHVDYAICSANFWPPGCETTAQVFEFLSAIPNVAITHGEKPIEYAVGLEPTGDGRGQFGRLEVPAVTTVDTLGAGDFFHGAFCHFLRQANLQKDFQAALAQASAVAARSCQSFGTRQWLELD
jgi:sugar/nucleoside kinase (ribokinase family)